VNETLCRALIQAQLTEEDVAARLQVDPKTVRRWLEGRVPYMRHRWAIAAMLAVDETDLWPQLRRTLARPDEVLAVYPHRDTVPQDVWLRLFGSARHEIGILDDTGMPLCRDQQVMEVLAERLGRGVSVRICVYDSEASGVPQCAVQPESSDALSTSVREALAVYAPLREKGQAEIRFHLGIAYSSMCFADDQLLVSQQVYGVAAGQAPVLHLRLTEGGDMAAAYRDAFERVWVAARSAA
jgi:transcriptional regulator with XRE-family HTH domain